MQLLDSIIESPVLILGTASVYDGRPISTHHHTSELIHSAIRINPLDYKLSSFLSFGVWFGITMKMGRWSDMSAIQMPESVPFRWVLVNILSNNVALVSVIRVGRSIFGKNAWENIWFRKDWLCLTLVYFRISKCLFSPWKYQGFPINVNIHLR